MSKGLGPETLSNAVVAALVKGEIITLFARRGMFTEGDEFDVVSEGTTDPDLLKPAYRRTANTVTRVSAVGTVTGVHPAAMLDPEAGASRHVFISSGPGDLVIVRVTVDSVPVLSEMAFAARSAGLEGAIHG
ncbi:hypothetical protein MNBD_ACTINO02-2122 [hydrothermal vent metagenome]|uniref:Uncharacterized protein n=1 Tax=hydrothermal vent metagenome TaxID=652676 RepID=A0A3B0SPJ1_9ZZZZ